MFSFALRRSWRAPARAPGRIDLVRRARLGHRAARPAFLIGVLLLLVAGLVPGLGSGPERPVAAQAQDDPYRFLAVKGWRGTFSWKMTDQGEARVSQGLLTWSGSHYADGQFTANEQDFSQPKEPTWKGPATGSGSIHDTATLRDDTCVETLTYQGAGPMPGVLGPGDGLKPGPLRATVTISLEDGEYALGLGETLDVHYHGVRACRYGTSVSDDDFTTQLGGGGFSNRQAVGKLPDTGLVLSGSGSFRSKLAQTLDLSYDEGGEVLWEYSWHIEPVGAEELEVVVKPQSYDQWRPKGNVIRGGGNVSTGPGPGLAAPAAQSVGVEVEEADPDYLAVNAVLQTKDGSAPQQKADKFLFELVRGSREPGATLNYPLDSLQAEQPDLRFDPRANPPGKLKVTDPDGLLAETVESRILQATANISSYDWGGWGELRVTAIMPGGQRIVGHLEGDPAQANVRLPKRPPTSLIADSWKQAQGVAGLADDDDSENDPVGDGHKGDGLTLYEEYRGFYEKEAHIQGDPKKKDFFIRNKVGWNTMAGIYYFAALSGLTVHPELWATQLPADRVINKNRREGPHLVDQHAVILTQGRQHYVSRAEGGPGTPKKVDKISLMWELNPDVAGQTLDEQPVSAVMRTRNIAHELLHAAGVWHHGEGDGYVIWQREEINGKPVIMEYQTDQRGNKVQPGTPVSIYLEPDGTGVDLSMDPDDSQFAGGWKMYLGKEGGNHSGDENCVMRYTAAQAYVAPPRPGEPNVRYYVGPVEQIGFRLCTLPTGTGVNSKDHVPQSRYGDAERGDCTHQICVNDLYADDKLHDRNLR
jgi:hypothetical protein